MSLQAKISEVVAAIAADVKAAAEANGLKADQSTTYTKTESDTADEAVLAAAAAAAEAAYIDDATLVHKTGNETIEGIKTFSSTVVGSVSGNAGTATTATNQSGGTVDATSIDYSTTLTGGTGVVNLGNGQIYKDTVGNVGIGTTSPQAKLQVVAPGPYSPALSVSSNNSAANWARMDIKNVNAAQPIILYQEQSGQFNIRTDGLYPIAFEINGNQRMIIDPSGPLLVGYASSNGAYKLQVNSQIFSTSNTVATSDGRYKENIKPITGALALVQALNPVTFNWKPHPVHSFVEGTTTGFIAQEVQAALANTPYLNSIVKANQCTIVPAEYETVELSPAVEEVKDEDGNVTTPASEARTEQKLISAAITEDFLGIAEGSLISILMAAVKELTARIETLEAK